MDVDGTAAISPATVLGHSSFEKPFIAHRPEGPEDTDTVTARAARNDEFFRRSAESVRTETVPRSDFMQQLRREMRRSERSKTPLSVVIYRLDESNVSHVTDAQCLLEALHDVSRETDLVGHVGDASIAVLCLDTDPGGMQAFMQKLERRLGNVPLKVTAATYPDLLFEQLADGSSRLASFVPFLGFEAANGGQGVYPLKRCLDVVLTFFLIFALSPLMLFIAILVAFTSRGPVIFSQQRLGKNGIPFTFYKFRSMFTNVDDCIHRDFVAGLIKKGEQGGEKFDGSKPAEYKLKSDLRVTAIGKFLRKSSIDELPQLFNVLRGDMSLVGPRPPIPYEAWQYRPWHLRRVLAVKPGITGLWQVEGRSRVSFNEMVRMDLRYIRDCSLALDLTLMLRTVPVVLRCDGAV